MPKIIGQSIGEHREQTRDRLFQAVAELLAEKSYEQITLSMVARRAEVGRTAIYNHFPDKDGLLFDFINQTTLDFAHNLQASLDRQTNPLDKLCIYIRYQLALKMQGSIVWRADLRTLVSHQNRLRFHEHAIVVQDQLSHILHHAMGIGLIPRQDVWTLTRLIHSCIAATDSEQLEALQLVEEFILRGAGATPDYRRLPISDQDPLNFTVNHASNDTAQPDWTRSAVGCPVHHV